MDGWMKGFIGSIDARELVYAGSFVDALDRPRVLIHLVRGRLPSHRWRSSTTQNLCWCRFRELTLYTTFR